MEKILKFAVCSFLFATTFFTVEAKANHDAALIPVDPEMIYGAVKHANSDKPIKDVMITVIQLQTAREKTMQSNQAGEFGIDDLPPGTYKIVFQKDGFKKVVKDKITVKPDRTVELQIEMEESSYELGPSLFHFFKY